MSSSRARTAATGSRVAAARRASACCRSATEPGTRSRPRCATRSRAPTSDTFPKSPLAELARTENGWRARCGDHTIDATTVVLAAGGRCYRVAQERNELSTNHPGATGEVTQIAVDLGAELRDFDALQYHPNGGAWPENMQGYSIPETTRAYGAVLLNADGEEFTDSLGPRDAVSQAIFEEVEQGQRRRDAGRPAGRLPRHDAHRGRRRERVPAVHAAPVPCGRDRPAEGTDPDLPRPPLPERRPRDRRGCTDDARRCSTRAVRSPAARTDATA